MISSEGTKLPKLIAIVGQEASGKDSYGEHLGELGYMHVSAGDVIRARARAEGFSDPISREVLSQVGDRLKQQFGPSPITESSIERHQQQQELYPSGLVISGLRRVGELMAFKKHGAVVVWLDASTELRFNNQSSRARGDNQDFEDFKAQGDKEYFGTTDGGASGVNLQAVEALADIKVPNKGTLIDLYTNADKALEDL
jgi:dephospho-CoA kinase